MPTDHCRASSAVIGTRYDNLTTTRRPMLYVLLYENECHSVAFGHPRQDTGTIARHESGTCCIHEVCIPGAPPYFIAQNSDGLGCVSQTGSMSSAGSLTGCFISGKSRINSVSNRRTELCVF